jgi:phosphatidylserine decarboxylase
MLTTKTSLTYMNDQTYGWFSPKAINDSVDYALFKCDPSKPHYGFKSWNQWFLREFKGGVRPIGRGAPANKKISQNDIIVSSC